MREEPASERGLPPPQNPQADLQTRDKEGAPFRWQAPDGVMHAAEGAELVRGDPRTHWMWTRCGSHDIAPNSVWASREALSCRSCIAIEHEERDD